MTQINQKEIPLSSICANPSLSFHLEQSSLRGPHALLPAPLEPTPIRCNPEYATETAFNKPNDLHNTECEGQVSALLLLDMLSVPSPLSGLQNTTFSWICSDHSGHSFFVSFSQTSVLGTCLFLFTFSLLCGFIHCAKALSILLQLSSLHVQPIHMFNPLLDI